MPFLPLCGGFAVCVRVFRKGRYRGFLGMVTAFNIVYNTVINFIGRLNCRMLGIGNQRSQARDAKPER
jgi:hypothetical protein